MELSDALDHLDELLTDALNIDREVRRLDLPKKTKDDVINSLTKVADNILISTKRLSSAIPSKGTNEETHED